MSMIKMFSTATRLLAVVALAGTIASCGEKGKNEPSISPSVAKYLHIGYGVGYSGDAEGYLLPSADLSQGTISFLGRGFSIEKARTHRCYASSDGSTLYNLEYGKGNIVKYQAVGGTEMYKKVGEKNISQAIGTTHPRWRVINDDTALLYHIEVKHLKNSDGTHAKTQAIVRMVKIDLSGSMVVNPAVEIELPAETETSVSNLHIWRIDQPVIASGKVYIGVAKQGYDPKTGKTIRTTNYAASTLVLDYPSFQNPRIIRSALGTGETYGFRTPSYLVDESGDVYHTSMSPLRISKIKNANYDDSYDFDLAKALGMNAVGGTGIFYTGNGIAYVPFYDADKGADVKQAAWGVARVDIKNKTAIKLNLPEGLWLRYYQNAKLSDGKLYMAICPLKENGNIYIFDPANTTANGFTKGASLGVSGEGFYLGVF